jgi:hypothetical protein
MKTTYNIMYHIIDAGLLTLLCVLLIPVSIPCIILRKLEQYFPGPGVPDNGPVFLNDIRYVILFIPNMIDRLFNIKR